MRNLIIKMSLVSSIALTLFGSPAHADRQGGGGLAKAVGFNVLPSVQQPIVGNTANLVGEWVRFVDLSDQTIAFEYSLIRDGKLQIQQVNAAKADFGPETQNLLRALAISKKSGEWVTLSLE